MAKLMSIDRNRFRTREYHATVFTPGLYFSPGKIVSALVPQYADILDGEPAIIPVPADLPPEVPRIVLPSRSGEHRVQISPARIDVYWKNQNGFWEFPDFLVFASKLLQDYLRTVRGAAMRLAAMTKRFAADPNPAPAVVAHFCKENLIRGPLNRPQQFQVHVHKVFKLAKQYDVNSWFRVKAATTPECGIVIEQDFNTLAGSDHEFDGSELAAFFAAVPCGMNEVLALYFPEESDA